MNSKADAETPAFDTVKLAFAVLLLIGGVVGFYYFENQAQQIIRVVGLLVVAAVALGISLQTVKGREVSSFVREAQIEVRKVVWPTKQETVQTTLIVIVVVIIVAIFLWLLDMALGGIVRSVMNTGA
ncbi:MAG: preprotein translocase subunit SecE [Gammaproteobacteria bacterium]